MAEEALPIVRGYQYSLRMAVTGGDNPVFPEGAKLRAQVREYAGAPRLLAELTFDNGGLRRVSNDSVDMVMSEATTRAIGNSSAVVEFSRTDVTPFAYLYIMLRIPVMKDQISAPVVVTVKPALAVALSTPPAFYGGLAGVLQGAGTAFAFLSSLAGALLSGSALGSGSGTAALRSIVDAVMAGNAAGAGSAIGALSAQAIAGLSGAAAGAGSGVAVLRSILNAALAGAAAGSGAGVGTLQTAPMAMLARNARIAAVGDSNTQYGTSYATNLFHTAVSDIPAVAAMGGDYNIDIFPAMYSTYPGWQGYNQGIAGDTFTGISARLTDALKYQPDAVYLAGLTNDGTGANAAALYTADAQRAHDAGVKWVLLRAVPPKSGAAWNAQAHTNSLAANAVLKQFADDNPTWCKFVDIYTPNIKDTGEAKDGYLRDGLHFTEAGVASNLTVLKSILDAITEPGPPNLVATRSAGNLLINGGLLTGSGGTKSVVTGSVPDGWSASLSGTSAVVASLSANADTGGQVLQLDITPATGTGNDTLTITPIASTAVASDQWYIGWMEIECGGPYIDANLRHVGTNGDNATTFVSASGRSLYPKQFLRTPPFKGAGTTKPSIQLSIPKGEAPFSVKLRRVVLVPIEDPYVTWKVTTPPVNTAAPSVSIPGARAVGSVVTINPGAWSGVLGGNQQQRGIARLGIGTATSRRTSTSRRLARTRCSRRTSAKKSTSTSRPPTRRRRVRLPSASGFLETSRRRW